MNGGDSYEVMTGAMESMGFNKEEVRGVFLVVSSK